MNSLLALLALLAAEPNEPAAPAEVLDVIAAELLTLEAAPSDAEKQTFLGVAAYPLPDPLRAHFDLPPGFALIVYHIWPDSPAAKAGIQPHDVLQKLDDQLLINTEQFTVLVRARKPGDKVKLSIIRKGKAEVIEAELGERSLEGTDVIRGYEAMLRKANDDVADIEAQVERQQRELGQQMEETVKRLREAAYGSKAVQRAVAKYNDGEHELTLTVTDGNKHLEAKDKEGNTLFDGPINTPQENEQVPAEVREKLEKLSAQTKIEVGGGTKAE